MQVDQGARSHYDNGMTSADMDAALRVARARGEIIMFRSTGPWAKRWIERGYPTKGFHVKGKSSNWGPQAGFVPWEGIYSKVGHDAAAVAKGNKLNKEGVDGGHARKVPLVLTFEQILEQANRPEGRPLRTALTAIKSTGVVSNRSDVYLYALRPGDAQPFAFHARVRLDGLYEIRVFPDDCGSMTPDRLAMRVHHAKPLLVMGTTEQGTDKPMTGDYDLFTVCPLIANFGAKDASLDPTLDGLDFGSGSSYAKRMAVSKAHLMAHLKNQNYAQATPLANSLRELASKPGWANQRGADGHASKSGLEDPHRGNLTRRIDEVLAALNAAMGATGNSRVLRRVHHNSEAGRPFAPSLDDGLPITTFHPVARVGVYGFSVGAIETDTELRQYLKNLIIAGYYVPRNLTWNMGSMLSAIQQRNRNL